GCAGLGCLALLHRSAGHPLIPTPSLARARHGIPWRARAVLGLGERRTLAPSWGRGGQDARDARGPGRAEARRGLEVVGENALSRARALVYDTPPSWSTFLRQRRRPRRPHPHRPRYPRRPPDDAEAPDDLAAPDGPVRSR